MKESNELALQWISMGDEDLKSAQILIENKGSFRAIGRNTLFCKSKDR